MLTLEGRVLEGGRAAAGAVVLSSAGGRAVSDEEGRFRLELELPAEAERLQVTAARGSGADAAVTSITVPIDGRGSGNTLGGLELSLEVGSCQPGWLPALGGRPGVNGEVRALAVFDDGDGPTLFVGGDFQIAGGTFSNRIARWDGTGWSTPGPGLNGKVHALLVFDDGGGPALYAGGEFLWTTGGTLELVTRIGKWDGTSWQNLGQGINGAVLAMTAIDAGEAGGPVLYAGGIFTAAGGIPASNIARWDGSMWRGLGTGVDAAVQALAIYDDGGGAGPRLHAGGTFQNAGGVQAFHVARWDGLAWAPLGLGLNAQVRALMVFDDGGGAGPRLYAGGAFNSAGTVAVNQVAAWNGATWSPLGSGIGALVRSFAIHDDGTGGGPALHAGGDFGVRKWRGTEWANLGAGPGPSWVNALAAYDEGDGQPALFAGGSLSTRHIERWSAQTWTVVGSGPDNRVLALESFADQPGEAPKLYLGGEFRRIGDEVLSRIGRWDGTSVMDVGGGVTAFGSDIVRTLAAIDLEDGLGPILYAMGNFYGMGGLFTNGFARWNGTRWLSTPEMHQQGSLWALAGFDAGTGPKVYVGGSFSSAGGFPANNLATWDGAIWFPVQGGVAGGAILTMQVFDDGSGPALYVAGTFTSAGGQPANRIARWDGASWSPLGSGFEGSIFTTSVRALEVFDDGSGSGPALYVGGSFTNAGGVPAANIARWDGVAWSPLGSGVSGGNGPDVQALAVFDDGSGAGPALFAGGEFTVAGGVAASRIARWDGTAWSPLGSGVGGPTTGSSNPGPQVLALRVHDDGSGTGPALFVGGRFVVVHETADSFVAKWGGCPPQAVGTSFCWGDGSATACPCGNAGAPGEGCANSTGQGAVLSASGTASVAAADLMLQGSQLAPAQFGLYFQGDQAVNGGAGAIFGDGLRCAGVGVERLQTVASGAGGTSSTSVDIAAVGGVLPGDTKRYQLWYRDPQPGGPCGGGFNLTNGLEIAWAP